MSLSQAMRRSSRSVAAGIRRAAGAPQTAPSAAEGASAGAGAPSRNVSPAMKQYLDTQAYFLGEKPVRGGRKIAGWEWSFIVFVGAIVWAGVAISKQPSQAPIYEWARDEAEERLRRRILGLPVEFGYNYAALRAIAERNGDELDE